MGVSGILIAADQTQAEIEPEQLTIETLPKEISPHHLWVGDMNFGALLEGRSILVDADEAKYLGMISTGIFTYRVVLPSHLREIYSVEIYFSRGTRGKRTDVVSIWDPETLSVVEEIEMTPKRATGLPQRNYTELSDDDRFLYSFNSTPAQSVNVVDVKNRKFVEEIETAGCAMVYAAPGRRFNLLCQDGGMMTVSLDRKGKLKNKERSKPFFDVQEDPVTEKAARWGDIWLFPSFEGYMYPVDVSGKKPKFGDRWSLLSDAERADNWRIGGLHSTALHEETNSLYVLAHQGGRETMADPGQEVWVYDVRTKKRTNKITLENLATSIAVSSDSDAVLATSFFGPTIDIYNAKTGEFLRAVESGASAPLQLVFP